MNLAELEKRLAERSATMTIAHSQDSWVVWLYAGDDPVAAFFLDIDPVLEVAVRGVFMKGDEYAKEAAAEETKTPSAAPSGTVEITDDD